MSSEASPLFPREPLDPIVSEVTGIEGNYLIPLAEERFRLGGALPYRSGLGAHIGPKVQ